MIPKERQWDLVSKDRAGDSVEKMDKGIWLKNEQRDLVPKKG